MTKRIVVSFIVALGAVCLLLIVSHRGDESLFRQRVMGGDQGFVVTHDVPHFRFKVPAGFAQFLPEQLKEPYLYGFIEKNCQQDEDHVCLSISVATMGGMINPTEPFDEERARIAMLRGVKKSAPDANPAITFERLAVMGYPMPLSILRDVKMGENPIVITAVEIPLKQEAFILSVIGPADQEQKVKALLTEVADSFDGEVVPRK